MECSVWMIWLTRIYWSIAIASSAATLVSNGAADLSKHGKTRAWSAAQQQEQQQQQQQQQKEPLKGRARAWKSLCDLTVPKCWFAHFYFVALTWSALLLVLVLLFEDVMFPVEWVLTIVGVCQSVQDGLDPKPVIDLGSKITLTLFLAHSSRRLYESIFVTRFSRTARMHAFGYLIGITFYLALPWTVVIESSLYTQRNPGSLDGLSSLSRNLGMLLFALASFQQNRCHTVLADLRREMNPRQEARFEHIFKFSGTSDTQAEMSSACKQYFCPKGGLFNLVSSPHYLMEIVLYFGFVLLVPRNASLWMALVFVSVTLISSALETHKFYKEKFDDVPAPFAVIPAMI